MRITRDRMSGVLGLAPRPTRVWEHQFDGHDDEIAKLATMDWDQIPADSMWYYVHDLSYMDLQPDLFRHAFPAVLRYWYESLMDNRDAAWGDADFHYSLMRGRVADKMLNDAEREALYSFFSDGMLDRIEAERGFLYSHSRDSMVPSGQSANAWIARFNSLGIVAPVIPRIWNDWWALDHPGRAVCAVMYASGLVYLRAENPIYAQWTPEFGGGGPYLTETDSSIFDWAWREDNLAFLRETLSVPYLLNKLDRAATVLADCPEAAIATGVAEDAKSRTDVIELRIGDLLENLARLELAKDHWD